MPRISMTAPSIALTITTTLGACGRRIPAERRGGILGWSSWAVDGPYSYNNIYDQWGNITQRNGWGVPNASYTASYSNNKRVGLSYDAAGNFTADGSVTYDATGQQISFPGGGMLHAYDGDGLRGKKTENGVITYYLRSTVLGGQVVSELNSSGIWMRGYVYLGGQLVAIQSGLSVNTVHQDPVTKSQRVTNSSGTVISTIDLDPWGAETSRSSNQAFQPQRYTHIRVTRMVAMTRCIVVTAAIGRASLNPTLTTAVTT